MDYKNINDNEVLNLTNMSDEYLYLLYDKYKPLINKICSIYYDKNKSVDLDDLSQEAFIAFYYAVCNYNVNRDTIFFTYLVVCIKSRLNDYVRRVKSNKNYVLENSISFSTKIDEWRSLEDVLSYGDDTYLYVSLDEFYDNLVLFKNSLSNKEASIFELKFNGFKVSEISKLLDINRKTVSNNLRNIRYKFRKIYNLHCVF